MHQDVGQLNIWMLISFIILFMIDLYKDNHMRVYVLFTLKNFSSETIDWIFTRFHRNVPKIEVKNFSSPLQKNQPCGVIKAL